MLSLYFFIILLSHHIDMFSFPKKPNQVFLLQNFIDFRSFLIYVQEPKVMN